MSETTYLKLFKHDNPSANENQFDVDKSLNDNWDKLDDFAGDVNEKVQEIEGNIAEQEQDIVYVKEELETEINELQKDIQANSIIEETEQAKSLYIDDATDSRGKIKVEGNVEQETRSGKNKLDLTKMETKTANGVTCTNNKDGSITLNGTCTANNTVFYIQSGIKVKVNKTTISVYLKNGTITSSKNPSLRLATEDYSYICNTALKNLSGSNTTVKSTVSDKDGEKLTATIRIEEGDVYNNFTIRAMVTDDPEDLVYEEYGTSPSINFPSKVQCLGSNINKFNKDTITQNKYIDTAGTLVTQEGTMCSDFIEVAENENITISGRTNWNSIGIYDEDKTFIRRVSTTNPNGTILISSECRYIRINGLIQDIENIKVEEAETATTYSPYRAG